MRGKQILGIDIGGSALKAAIVDTATGARISQRLIVPVPATAKPERFIEKIASIASELSWDGMVGIGFPGAIVNGHVRFVGNLSRRWIGWDLGAHLWRHFGISAFLINDADAAGMAEVRFGAAYQRKGVVLVLTAGTGIGSAVFVDGALVPNTELGQLTFRERPFERYAAPGARVREGLGLREWAARFSQYLRAVEEILWPDLIVVGGGISTEYLTWRRYLTNRTETVAAVLGNDAGLVGAALAGRAFSITKVPVRGMHRQSRVSVERAR